MHIRWFGTASIRITHAGHSILFDPFISRNKELRYVSAEELAGIGDIFLTHGHFDHIIDVPLLVLLRKKKVFCAPPIKDLLIKEGVMPDYIIAVNPGDTIKNGPFSINVLAGEHSKTDGLLTLQTLFGCRTLLNFSDFRRLLKLHHKFPLGQILTYHIEAGGRTVFHMGSLNFSARQAYPQGVDLMTLPFQGRSNIAHHALQLVERIKPHTVFLHHFDDSFPPVSRQINTTQFVKTLLNVHPGMKVITPEYLQAYLV